MTTDRALKQFKIIDVQGPAEKGTLNQFKDYYLKILYDPGEPYVQEEGLVVVRFFFVHHSGLASGDPSEAPFDEEAIGRVGYYVIHKLKSVLGLPGAPTDYSFQATEEEVRSLQEIDPKRVDIYEWQSIEDLRELHRERVFISCGQRNESEVALGESIAELVGKHTDLDGYFAQDQQSLDGVTRNIFQAIYNSAGFVAVMHRRDQLDDNSSEYRGSVWVEQEIAIAAFLVQVLGMRLPNRVFIQSGIRREGVRGFILLNAIEFEGNQEVIDDVTDWLPSLQDQILSNQELGAA